MGALSSAKVEVRGMTKGLCELLWLRNLLTETGFAPTCEILITLSNMIELNMSKLMDIL